MSQDFWQDIQDPVKRWLLAVTRGVVVCCSADQPEGDQQLHLRQHQQDQESGGGRLGQTHQPLPRLHRRPVQGRDPTRGALARRLRQR